MATIAKQEEDLAAIKDQLSRERDAALTSLQELKQESNAAIGFAEDKAKELLEELKVVHEEHRMAVEFTTKQVWSSRSLFVCLFVCQIV